MTGEPSVVETSLLSTAAWVLSGDISTAQVPGYKTHDPNRKRSPLMHTYTTRDGRMVMLMLLNSQPHWAPLCRMLDLASLINDPDYQDETARVANRDSLVEKIQAIIGARDWADWEPLFADFDAPWELIHTIEDVADDPQAIANDMLFPLQVGEHEVRMVAGPTAFNGLTTLPDSAASPGLGAHTDGLLGELGYDSEAIVALRREGVVQ
jgi:crotonobetainyl-CoA:carnitine CoA-transferase CaiB-like acyl-CoA transferase